MRESLHYSMIPIPQDNMNEIIFNGSRRILTNVSSNGYYGYQPQIHVQEKSNTQSSQMTGEICDMDVQFNNLPNTEEMQMENGIPRLVNRKRRWEYPDELDAFKKKAPK
ncbi:hypothetical protein NQ314_002128 [Rhamnusium bicolor]|uniref:Uncharacterized protein n=1 Tax=Rhamnusium bicolor TaxID=1586634 RepID=A0AAV8ZRM1_9CUCU|nr:hypothetical protein NQ314_002128 [Rhamnusium bicolor]